MNTLRVHTRPAASEDTFLVYWSNSDVLLRGCLEVTIKKSVPDKPIVAELSALHHLLAVRQVLGQNRVGTSGTRLIVSFGAIRKLSLCQSAKAHLAPFASFLATRFAGCQLEVGKETGWFEGQQPESLESITVKDPPRETIRLAGVGEVAVTRHVLDRLSERLPRDGRPGHARQAAWKKLSQLSSDPSIREVTRDSLWARAARGTQEGRYFLSDRHDLVLVVTNNRGEGRRLVTAYPATPQFRKEGGAAQCAAHG